MFPFQLFNTATYYLQEDNQNQSRLMHGEHAYPINRYHLSPILLYTIKGLVGFLFIFFNKQC